MFIKTSLTELKIVEERKDCRIRLQNGEWQKIVEGEHIPSTKGDVILRGNFHMLTPSGEYIGVFSGNTRIAFYTNHINLTFIESGGSTYVIDHENPLLGASACGVGLLILSLKTRGLLR